MYSPLDIWKLGQDWFQAPRDGGRGLRGRGRVRIKTNPSRFYPGFCAGEREAKRRRRQIADGRLRAA